MDSKNRLREIRRIHQASNRRMADFVSRLNQTFSPTRKENHPRVQYEYEEKNKCGAKGLTTGEWDPYYRAGDCDKHDAEYEKLLAGEKHSSAWVTTRDFVVRASRTMARGIYAVVAYPIYVLVGGVGGYIRMRYLELKGSSKK